MRYLNLLMAYGPKNRRIFLTVAANLLSGGNKNPGHDAFHLIIVRPTAPRAKAVITINRSPTVPGPVGYIIWQNFEQSKLAEDMFVHAYSRLVKCKKFRSRANIRMAHGSFKIQRNSLKENLVFQFLGIFAKKFSCPTLLNSIYQFF